MNKQIVKSGVTLSTSLLAYHLAKDNPFVPKVPAMLIGGFIGTVLSELIINNKYKHE